MTTQKPNSTTKFAEALIAKLEKGTAPWQRGWKVGEALASLPVNGSTHKVYRGGNILRLWMSQEDQGFEDNRWMTFKQAQTLGLRIKKGSHGTCIQHFNWFDTTDKETGIPTKVPVLKTFVVFNGEQIDGIAPLPKVETVAPSEVEILSIGEKILKNSGAKIEFGGSKAFYRPADDSIRLPNREDFVNTAEFYSTALHELAHWTGAKTRLNRDLRNKFGTQDYAREELRAEIASWMIAVETGLPTTADNSTSYVASWVKKLQEKPAEIISACNDAQKIRDYIMQFAVDAEEANPSNTEFVEITA